MKRISHLSTSIIALLVVFFSFYISGMTVHAETAENYDSVGGRVLFISSYSYAWDTVQDQINGIKDGLGATTTLDYEFMDTKRITAKEYQERFYEDLKYKLSVVEPYDVVIVGDDAALLFIKEYRDSLFPDTPIIFEGVNDEQLAQTMAEDPMITGIMEKLSLEKNIDFAKMLRPGAERVVAILDDTVTGQAERKAFYACQDLYPDLTFTEINASKYTNKQLKLKLGQYGKNSIMIYIVFSEDAEGKNYSSSEAIRLLVENTRIPIFRMVDAGIGDGILGGYVVSMYKSGEIAANMAMKIMSGTVSIEELGLIDESPNIYRVDEQVMKKYEISLSKLPADTEIVNYTEPYFKRNKEVLVPVTVILCVLLCVLLAIVLDNTRRRKLYRELEEAREIMETASLHDFLTGIPNRTKLMMDLENLIHNNIKCTVYMIDIDEFKKINDGYGHAAGDDALREISSRMKELHSPLLVPYRYAGDEFIIIVKSTQRRIVEKTAVQCKALFEKPFTLAGEKRKVTGSIGIASYPKDADTLEKLIECADQAMYGIKMSGKNDFAYYDASKDIVEET